MAYSATGKRVVITGASSGIGAALARRLAGQGAVVGLIARRSERLAEVLADCRRTSPDSTMWVADLAQTATVGQLGLRAWDDLGGIDVLVNNAAMPKRRAAHALDPAEVETVMRVNFLAAMRLTLAVLPRSWNAGTASSSTCPAWVAGWASSTRPPTAPASSRSAAGANRWPSTCMAAVSA
jgi:short-subunit dehydrogenase